MHLSAIPILYLDLSRFPFWIESGHPTLAKAGAIWGFNTRSQAFTSDTVPLLSANFSAGTSIFWAMVSSRLLRWALLFTG